MTTIQPATLKFLADLSKNNEREWFQDNRGRYETAKENVIAFATDLLKEATAIDQTLVGLEPKKCVFRINRDVRFSKDKSPYKTNMGVYFNKGGKKAPTAGYYINIEASGTFVGGGNYMPEAADLKKIREEIDYSFDEFRGIITAPDFKEYYGEMTVEEKLLLKRPPKGYDAENPAIEFLKWKSFTAFRNFSDKQVTHKNFPENCVKGITVLKPLLDFLNR